MSHPRPRVCKALRLCAATLALGMGLLAGCSGGGGGASPGTPPGPVLPMTLSGVISYDRVPFAATPTAGLDYAAVRRAPARAVVVELLRADRTVLASTVTDDSGRYVFSAPANTELLVRARAQSRAEGTASRPASWNLRVRDNTDGNAIYAIEGSLAGSGSVDQVRNLHAGSGWTGAGYGESRSAGPFAVLDTLYSALQLAVSGDASQRFGDLDIYWSPGNRASEQFRPAVGEILTTSYRSILDDPAQGGIYVQGLANVDTDEYDAHVLAHEFFHFLEDLAARSDTTGGTHSLFQKLDARLAFSEGFGNAWAAMVTGDPLYRDTAAARQGESAYFDLENNQWQAFGRTPGWFNEVSVQSVVYDFFDATTDGVDTLALGITPLYAALRGDLRNGPALTTLFAFTAALERQAGVSSAGVRALLEAQDIGRGVAVPDAWATGEGNAGGNPDALPLYLPLSLNGPPVLACTNASAGVDNKLGNRRLLRFQLSQGRRVQIVVRSTDPGTPAPDPDLVLFRAGRLASAETVAPFVERYEGDLAAGEYVLEVYEWTHADPAGLAIRPRTCMNVSLSG